MTISRDVVIRPDLIQDKPTRDFVDSVRRYFSEALLPNFRGDFYTLSATANGTFIVPHHLGFTPEDVIQTSITGGVVAWNYGNFNQTNIEFVVTGVVAGTPCVVRAFIGTYGGS